MLKRELEWVRGLLEARPALWIRRSPAPLEHGRPWRLTFARTASPAGLCALQTLTAVMLASSGRKTQSIPSSQVAKIPLFSATGVGLDPDKTILQPESRLTTTLVVSPIDPGARTFALYEGEDATTQAGRARRFLGGPRYRAQITPVRHPGGRRRITPVIPRSLDSQSSNETWGTAFRQPILELIVGRNGLERRWCRL